MATSNITLYKTNLTPTKYWKLDDIEAYLNTCNSYPILGLKYVKPDLTNTIKLPFTQEFFKGLGFNYLKVVTEESDDKKVSRTHTEYYFINSYDWGGRKGVKVNLTLDTLNTVSGTEMTDITQIIREHQDRWYKSGDNFYAKVDKYSEGLGAVKDHLESSTSLQPSNMYAIQISRNATTPDLTDKTPYGTYFCFDSSKTWDNGQSSTSHYSMDASTYYNLNKSILIVEGNTTFENQTGTYNIGTDTETFDNVTGILRACIIEQYTRQSGSTYNFTCKMHKLYYTGDTYPYNYLGRKEGASFTWTISSKAASDVIAGFWNMKYYYTLDNTTYNNYQNNQLDALLAQATPITINSGTYPARKTIAFKNLDRTNSAIMGIYQVPMITMDTTNATFVEGYNLVKLKSYDQNYALPNTATLNKLYTDAIPSPQDERSKVFETKLYNNEITDFGVYYQGDCLFNFDATRYNSLAIPTLYSSIRINEDNPQLLRFTFNCQQYNFISKYEQYAFMATKYTVPLYTNEWNEYVRNGYNYDVAARQREKSLQAWNIAANAVSAATSLGGSLLGASMRLPEIATANLTNTAQKEALERFKQYGYNKATATPQEGSEGFLGIPRNYDVLLEDTRAANGQPLMQPGMTTARTKTLTMASSIVKAGITDSLGTMVVTQGISSINSLVSASYAVKTAAANYQQTINTKAASHTAIAGNNTDYSAAVDNKVEFQVWQPQEYILENIAKVFHLTGYSHPVQEVPNTKSRYWFNYLQCIPTWSEATINNYRPEFLNDLSEKYQSGVTIFHYKDGYDLDQEKENMEVNLI